MRWSGVLGCGIILAGLVPATAADRACQPQKWQKAIARFEALDQDDPPPQHGILFVGSSSIVLWDLAASFPGLGAINRGFGGSEICDSIYYAETVVFKHKPRVVVLYAGDNDIDRGKSAEQVHRDFVEFRDQLFEALPSTRLLYVAIKPSRARWSKSSIMQAANEMIAGECREDARLTFVDIWKPMLSEEGMPPAHWFIEDELHLSDKGYQLWTSLVTPHLPGGTQ